MIPDVDVEVKVYNLKFTCHICTDIQSNISWQSPQTSSHLQIKATNLKCIPIVLPSNTCKTDLGTKAGNYLEVQL